MYNFKIILIFRPYNKFLKDPQPGLVPSKGVEEFMKHDIIKPLQKPSLYKSIPRQPRKNWSLNTIKNCPIEPNLPKRQQFKNYFFYKFPRDEKEVEKYRNYFLPTDHIGIANPTKINNKQTTNFLQMKSKYNSQSFSDSEFLPEVGKNLVNNKSSVSYNIINNEDNKFHIMESAVMKNLYNKKIGIAKYADSNSPFAVKPNKMYNKAYNENSDIFKSYKGIFTKMYDDAARNGNIYKPFDTSKRRYHNSKSVIL